MGSFTDIANLMCGIPKNVFENDSSNPYSILIDFDRWFEWQVLVTFHGKTWIEATCEMRRREYYRRSLDFLLARMPILVDRHMLKYTTS